MNVHCQTNLDLAGERWPDWLPAVPNVGDHIQSRLKHGDFQLTLQVTRITWKYLESGNEYVPVIDLHMTEFQKRLPATKRGADTGSIVAFYEWYAPLVGRTVHSFI